VWNAEKYFVFIDLAWWPAAVLPAAQAPLAMVLR